MNNKSLRHPMFDLEYRRIQVTLDWHGINLLIPPLDLQAGWPGRYINVRHCRGLLMVLLQQKDPLELFVKSREFLPGSGFLSRRDMTQLLKATKNQIPSSFLPINSQESL